MFEGNWWLYGADIVVVERTLCCMERLLLLLSGLCVVRSDYCCGRAKLVLYGVDILVVERTSYG